MANGCSIHQYFDPDCHVCTHNLQFPVAGSQWQNIKRGTLYRVTDVITHTETGELLVTYQSVENSKSKWVRPLLMWHEKFVEVDS